MSYEEQSERYRTMTNRNRYEMAIREQAHLTFLNDADSANAGLADAVVEGDMKAIDAVMAAICVGPNSGTLSDDGGLLSAVQAAWPDVAGALYPQEV